LGTLLSFGDGVSGKRSGGGRRKEVGKRGKFWGGEGG